MRQRRLHTVAGLLLAVVFLIALAGDARAGLRQPGARAVIGGAGYVIAGGGGTSSGGPYVLTAVIGQPLIGTLAGGAFSLESGFLATVQAPPPTPTPPPTTVYLPLLVR